MTESWSVTNKDQAEFFCSYIKGQQDAGIDRIYEIKVGNRTNRQNRAAHLCLRNLAQALTDAGVTFTHPMNPEYECVYTEENCKELLLRPFIEKLYNKTSTKTLTTKELSFAFELMLTRVAEVTGVVVHFPQDEL